MIYGLPPLRLGDTWRGSIAVVLACIFVPLIEVIVWCMNKIVDMMDR